MASEEGYQAWVADRDKRIERHRAKRLGQTCTTAAQEFSDSQPDENKPPVHTGLIDKANSFLADMAVVLGEVEPMPVVPARGLSTPGLHTTMQGALPGLRQAG